MPSTPAVHRLVPLAHVSSVDASLGFYADLGFRTANALRSPDGRAFWALATTAPALVDRPQGHGGAEIMLARASGPIDPGAQAVLFYMYTSDVAALRTHLLARGLRDGGRYAGQPGPGDGRRVVFDVSRPDYMQHGEIRVHDPDGYCILIGQLGPA